MHSEMGYCQGYLFTFSALWHLQLTLMGLGSRIRHLMLVIYNQVSSWGPVKGLSCLNLGNEWYLDCPQVSCQLSSSAKDRRVSLGFHVRSASPMRVSWIPQSISNDTRHLHQSTGPSSQCPAKDEANHCQGFSNCTRISMEYSGSSDPPLAHRQWLVDISTQEF